MLTVNPSSYVKLIIFFSSEWLTAFNCVASFYVLVSYEEVKAVWHYSVGKEYNVVSVIQFLQHEASKLLSFIFPYYILQNKSSFSPQHSFLTTLVPFLGQ
jgi:hypothetical protein